MVKDTPEAAAQEVVVKIPVLGAYSKTWPLNCPKSDKIVRDFADYLAKPDSNKGFAGIGMLFLLSTGEDKDLAPVKQWVHGFVGKPAPTYAWYLGYGGIPLCEYYLRTGDPVALPIIQSWVKSAAKAEYLDGWAGRGGVTGVDYGDGHLNAGGTAVVTFLMLAKECGADVHDSLLQRALGHFFRFAGRGNNPYGDDRPESSFVDNGKNGNLAFAMAAAASLTPDGEKSIYAAARDTCAMTGFYTTTYMLHGHTGGGIGENWRSTAMGLLYDKKPAQYREFMDNRKWHYELSRRFNGSFGILGGDENPKGGYYDSELWGAALRGHLHDPAQNPAHHRRATSKFAKPYQLPERPWGTAADDVFLSLESVPDADGKRLDLSGETLAIDSAKPLIERLLAMGDVGDDVLRRTMRHPDYLIRNLAAKNAVGIQFNYMWIKPGDRARPALIHEWIRSPDPRVRRAVARALAAYLPADKPELFLTPEVFASVIAMLKDPEESWWVKDAAHQSRRPRPGGLGGPACRSAAAVSQARGTVAAERGDHRAHSGGGRRALLSESAACHRRAAPFLPAGEHDQPFPLWNSARKPRRGQPRSAATRGHDSQGCLRWFCRRQDRGRRSGHHHRLRLAQEIPRQLPGRSRGRLRCAL